MPRKVIPAHKGIAVESWPIERLQPYARNPRKNDKAVDRMVASIQEYGFAIPILARGTGEVIDGHLRLKAAVKMGMAEVPVIPCDGWSDAQVKAFRLMVNRSVTWADWDMEALGAEFLELKALDFNLEMTGFDVREIDSFTLQPNPAEDDVPEVPIAPVSQLGDLWLMGEHRLLCGDSTKAEDVSRVMNENEANAVVTDVPYGISQESNGLRNLDYGEVSQEECTRKSIEALNYFSDVPSITAFCGDEQLSFIFKSFRKRTRRTLTWVKPNPTVLNGAHVFLPAQELAAHGRLPSAWFGGKCERSVWEGTAPRSRDHPNQKPVQLLEWVITKTCEPGGICADPFLGSGTTLVAADLTGRICYGLEISPAYCDVIVTRWQNLTGKQATLEGHGCTFEHAKFGRRLGAQDALKEEAHG